MIRIIESRTLLRFWVVGIPTIVLVSCNQPERDIRSLRAKSSNVLGPGAPGGGSSGGADAGVPPAGNGSLSCDNVQQVKSVIGLLEQKCAQCHGGDAIKGGFGKVTDLAALVQSKRIVPNQPQDSRLFTRVKNGTMPPGDSPDLSEEDMTLLQQWIGQGAVAASRAAVDEMATSCSTERVGGSGRTGTEGSADVSITDVLNGHCYSCHGANGSKAGGIDNILDLGLLVSDGFVVPGNPVGSKIFARITSASNPMPPSTLPRLSTAEERIVAEWIETEAEAATPGAVVPTPVALRLIKPEEEFSTVFVDLDSIAQVSSADARFKRYFSFANLANGGTSKERMQVFANSLSRFVNSLSNNRLIVRPTPIDLGGMYYRVDIRDYGWSAQDWENLVRVYPYASLQRSRTRAQAFQQLSGTSMPVLRADWFEFKAAQPQFYHQFLDIPAQDAQLQATLRLNVQRDLDQVVVGQGAQVTSVVRSGFLKSGVALHNRVIERHETLFGSYWLSYDFKAPNPANAAEVAAKDIFASPLGPVFNSQRSAFAQFGEGIAFAHDGGEIIFSLPNGLNGYMVIDNRGARLDAVPLDVAFDKARPEGIINGYSCMTCHASGLINQADDITRSTLGNGGFNADEREIVQRLYVDKLTFSQLLNDDNNQLYLPAAQRAGYTSEPTITVVSMAQFYEQDRTLAQVAGDFGLTTDNFLVFLNGSSNDLRRSLSSLTGSMTIDPLVYESLIGTIVFDFFGNL